MTYYLGATRFGWTPKQVDQVDPGLMDTLITIGGLVSAIAERNARR